MDGRDGRVAQPYPHRMILQRIQRKHRMYHYRELGIGTFVAGVNFCITNPREERAMGARGPK